MLTHYCHILGHNLGHNTERRGIHLLAALHGLDRSNLLDRSRRLHSTCYLSDFKVQ